MNNRKHADEQSGTAFSGGGRVQNEADRETTGDTVQGTDPYSNFTVPQDADVQADAPEQTSNPSEHEHTVTDDPSGRSDEVGDDPNAAADTPREAEEIQPESPA